MERWRWGRGDGIEKGVERMKEHAHFKTVAKTKLTVFLSNLNLNGSRVLPCT